MDKLIEALSSPGWWISVVVVGIVTSLVSAYMKPSIDRQLSKVSGWWKNRTDANREIDEWEIERLMNSEHERMMQGIEVSSYWTKTAVLTGYTIVMHVLYQLCNSRSYPEFILIILLINANFFLLFSYFTFHQAIKKENRLSKVRNRLWSADIEAHFAIRHPSVDTTRGQPG